MLLAREVKKIQNWLDAQIEINTKRNLLEDMLVDNTTLSTCFDAEDGIHLSNCIDKICEALKIEPEVKLGYIPNEYDYYSVEYKGVKFFELKAVKNDEADV